MPCMHAAMNGSCCASITGGPASLGEVSTDAVALGVGADASTLGLLFGAGVSPPHAIKKQTTNVAHPAFCIAASY